MKISKKDALGWFEFFAELPEEEELARMMDRAGCKRSVYEIGLSEEIIPQSLKLAPYVRRRLSFLRILRMLRIEGE